MKNQVLRNHQDQAELLAELGDRLQQIRQQQGLSLEQVAAKTLIPVRTLTAIEAGQLERLPEPVYIQGFLRRYADAIGINGAEFAVAFPTRFTIPPKRSLWNLSFRAQLRPLHLYLLYLALVAGSISGLSNLLNRSAGQLLVETVPGTQSVQPAPAATPSAPSSSRNLVGPPLPNTAQSRQPQFPPGTIGKPVRVGVKLTDQSWVRVVADGKTEFEGMLPEGTQRIWAADKEVTVRAGNAGGVLVSLNEGQAKPMGEPGTVEEVTFGSNNAQSASSFSTTDDRTLTAVNLGTD